LMPPPVKMAGYHLLLFIPAFKNRHCYLPCSVLMPRPMVSTWGS
jgi:hypothetical protein